MCGSRSQRFPVEMVNYYGILKKELNRTGTADEAEKRPADVIGGAVMVGRIAIGGAYVASRTSLDQPRNTRRSNDNDPAHPREPFPLVRRLECFSIVNNATPPRDPMTMTMRTKLEDKKHEDKEPSVVRKPGED